MRPISFVQQPTHVTCTSACLAMLTGINVDEVILNFHAQWKNDQTNPSEFLLQYGIEHEVNKDVFNRFVEWGFMYLLTVPSLNIDGGLHHIVLDLTGDTEKVFDPNMGKVEKRYYVSWSSQIKSDLEIALHGWLIDIKINPV